MKENELTAEKLRQEEELVFPDEFGTIKVIKSVVDVNATFNHNDCPFFWQT
ncbi:MAG: hypothetical protein V4598_12020 [Bdellovibrionota bacterium]